jgi:SAM-dependent methyltransferase
MSVLDMGCGRRPVVARDDRPAGTEYVALDLDSDEIKRAGETAYDDAIIADIDEHQPALDERFDVVISFQVLEHVRSLDKAIANAGEYLKPGGQFLSYFSGTFAIYAVINRLLPRRASRYVMTKLLPRRDQTSIFPAYYHKCWYGALRRLLVDWDDVSIVPIYRGATYFSWSPLVQRCYLSFEDWLVRRDHRNLAGYYCVSARKPLPALPAD